MNSELEKIDILRARLGVSYKEAKEVLEEAGGDVVQALILLEERGKGLSGKIEEEAKEVLDRIKTLLRKGRQYKIKVKKGDATVAELPVAVGVLGVLGALASSEIAFLSVLGTAAAMAGKYTLEIERGIDFNP